MRQITIVKLTIMVTVIKYWENHTATPSVFLRKMNFKEKNQEWSYKKLILTVEIVTKKCKENQREEEMSLHRQYKQNILL